MTDPIINVLKNAINTEKQILKDREEKEKLEKELADLKEKNDNSIFKRVKRGFFEAVNDFKESIK